MSDEKTSTNSSAGDSAPASQLPEMPLEQAGAVQEPTTPVSDPGPAPTVSAPWASTAVPAYAPAEQPAAPQAFSPAPAAEPASVAEQSEPTAPAQQEDWRESTSDSAVAETVAIAASAAAAQPATRREARAQTGVVEPLPAESAAVPPVAEPSRIDAALDLGGPERFDYPEVRSNRGAAGLIMLVSTVAFAVLYAALSAVVIGLASYPENFVANLVDLLLTPIFIVPVVVFAVLSVLLGLLANRAGWWLYGTGGLIIALLVAASIVGWIVLIGGGVLVNPFAEPGAAVAGVVYPSDLDQTIWLVVWAQVLAAGIAARESLLWFGAWAGRRGRKISRLNTEALAASDAARTE